MDQTVVFDELEKIGASKQRMAMSQSRSGRRPLHVDTLLRKEKDGTLYKTTGDDHKIASLRARAILALLEDMNKYASSLKMGDANPTLYAAQQNASAYGSLPESTRKLIESHPLVSQHGMTPHAAMQVAGWSLKPGQSVGDFFAEQHLNSVRGGQTQQPVAGGAATRPTAATPAAPAAATRANAPTRPVASRPPVPSRTDVAHAATIAAPSTPAPRAVPPISATRGVVDPLGKTMASVASPPIQAAARAPATALAAQARAPLAAQAGKVISAVKPMLPGIARAAGAGIVAGGIAGLLRPKNDPPTQQSVYM